MEAADPGARQSGPSSATLPERTHPPGLQPPRQPDQEVTKRPHQDHSAMATATLLHPSASYPSPAASYSPGYPPPGSSMISSTDSRRVPEDSDLSKRQSLPSISEVISNTKSTQYPHPPPAPASIQPSHSYSAPSFPGSLRSYGEAEKHPSPQGPRPASYPPQRESLTSFADSPRSSFNGRPALPPVSDRRPSPPGKPEYPPHHYTSDPQRDHRPVNGAYAHPPPPPAASASTPAPAYPSAPLPHGQIPLPSYPPSPRHGPPHGPPHAPPHAYAAYEQRGPAGHPEDDERAARPPYEHAMYAAPWNYGESLGRLAQSSRTLFSFAEAYGRIAQEQHGAHPIPERLPTEQEVNDMVANADMIRAALERVKDAVQQSIRNERAREPPKMKPAYEDEQDTAMYEEGIKSQYAITEVKKRRGRAAPPGRCHSCNRVDTPEWRRGPDGARTLCNACGLHYAKLERKRQLEQRNIRPKPEERA